MVLAQRPSPGRGGAGRTGPAALGADATPTRPTSGTLTPATRSRARSSRAQPVSGRGPALVTGGGGPGAAGAGRARARAAFVGPRASGRPGTAAKPPRLLPPASKVRERETEAGSGRAGSREPAPPRDSTAARKCPLRGKGRAPGGAGRELGAGPAVRDGWESPAGARWDPSGTRRECVPRPRPGGRALGTARRPLPYPQRPGDPSSERKRQTHLWPGETPI